MTISKEMFDRWDSEKTTPQLSGGVVSAEMFDTWDAETETPAGVPWWRGKGGPEAGGLEPQPLATIAIPEDSITIPEDSPTVEGEESFSIGEAFKTAGRRALPTLTRIGAGMSEQISGGLRNAGVALTALEGLQAAGTGLKPQTLGGETLGTAITKTATSSQEAASNVADRALKTLQSEGYHLPPELRQHIIDKPEILADPRWWIVNVGDAAVSMAPALLAAMFGNPLMGGVVGGGMEGGSLYHDMKKDGVNETKAQMGAVTFALTTGFLNKLGFDEVLAKRAGMSFVNRFLRSSAVEGASEGAEEPFQAVYEGIAKGKKLPEIYADVKESLKDSLDVMVSAAPTGGGASLLSGGTTEPANQQAPAAPEPAPSALLKGYGLTPHRIPNEEHMRRLEALKQFQEQLAADEAGVDQRYQEALAGSEDLGEQSAAPLNQETIELEAENHPKPADNAVNLDKNDKLEEKTQDGESIKEEVAAQKPQEEIGKEGEESGEVERHKKLDSVKPDGKKTSDRKRILIRHSLQESSAPEEEQLTEAGYIEVDGIFIDPDADSETLKTLSSEMWDVMKARGIVVLSTVNEDANWAAMSGSIVIGDKQRGEIKINKGGNPNFVEHNILHEIGHTVWQGLSKEQQSKLLEYERPITPYVAEEERSQQSGASNHVENFAESFAIDMLERLYGKSHGKGHKDNFKIEQQYQEIFDEINSETEQVNQGPTKTKASQKGKPQEEIGKEGEESGEVEKPRSWFRLGRDISFKLNRPLKPSRIEIQQIAKDLGITQADVRRAADFYNYGEEALIEGKAVPQVKTNQPITETNKETADGTEESTTKAEKVQETGTPERHGTEEGQQELSGEEEVAGGLTITDHGKKSIIVTGDIAAHEATFKAIKGGIRNKKRQGWVFSKAREAEVREALGKEVVKTQSRTETQPELDETAGQESSKEAEQAQELNFTQFASKYGYTSDYDITDHGTLSPSGRDRVSNRQKKESDQALEDRLASNKEGHEAFRRAIAAGEIVDADGKITKEGMKKESATQATKKAQQEIALATQGIERIKGLSSMAYTKSGRLKKSYQLAVDDYQAKIDKAQEALDGAEIKTQSRTETQPELKETATKPGREGDQSRKEVGRKDSAQLPTVEAGHYIKRKPSGLGGKKTAWEPVTRVDGDKIYLEQMLITNADVTDIRTDSPDLGRGEVIFKDGKAIERAKNDPTAPIAEKAQEVVGEAVEAATPEGVTVKASDLKEQKKYLLGNIDEAIKDYNLAQNGEPNSLLPDTVQADDIRTQYTIEVPGDGTFMVIGSQLEKFRNQVKKVFPATVPGKTKGKTAPRPTKSRIAHEGVSYTNPYVEGGKSVLPKFKKDEKVVVTSDGWVGNGTVLTKGKTPKGENVRILDSKVTRVGTPSETILIPTSVTKQAESNNVDIILSGGKNDIAVDANYFDPLRKMFPKAELREGDKENLVIFVENGTPVAYLMGKAVDVAQETAEPVKADKPKPTKKRKVKKAQVAPDETKTEAIDDMGEKIGGARKDLSIKSGKKPTIAKTPTGWRSRYRVTQGIEKQILRNGEAVDAPSSGKWGIFDTRKKSRWNIPRPLGNKYFDTEAEALAMMPGLAVAEKHRPRSIADGKFTIYRSMGTRKSVRVIAESFDTRDEAMRYMVKNAESLLETRLNFGEEVLPKPEVVMRSGKVHRDGNVTGDDFMNTFGFRATEFGNWVSKTEDRQEVMNHAYDALLDMAEILGITPRAVSLNGELALAFGARGHGLAGAAAHYEADYAVINLTKMAGAGHLAHEWFHALDHYVGRLDGKAKSGKEENSRGDLVYPTGRHGDVFASGGFSYSKSSGAREQVREAFKKLSMAIQRTGKEFVEKTDTAEKFVGDARDELSRQLKGIRNGLAEQLDPRYWKRKNKPATEEQLVRFDQLADMLASGEALETEFKADETKKRSRYSSISGRKTNPVLDEMSDIYKAVRGRTGFSASGDNRIGSLNSYMAPYRTRIAMLKDANAGTKKTRQVPTSFKRQAMAADQARAAYYWSTDHELAARAFAAYLEDKLTEKEASNDFLAYHAHGAVLVPIYPEGLFRPYPEGNERVAINKEFDILFKTFETKETDKGVALFSRRNKKAASDEAAFLLGDIFTRVKRKTAGNPKGTKALKPMVALQVEKIIKTLKLDNAPPVVTVQSEADLPRHLIELITGKKAQGEVPAIYDPQTGKVYMIADNIVNSSEIRTHILHEIPGHFGLRGVLGEELDPVLDMVAEHYGDRLQPIAVTYGLDLNTEQDRRVAAEEKLSFMQQDDSSRDQSFVKKVYAQIRALLRKLGFLQKMNDADIAELLSNAYEFARQGKTEKQPTWQGAGSTDKSISDPDSDVKPDDNIRFSRRRVKGNAAQEAALADTQAAPDSEKSFPERAKGLVGKINHVSMLDMRQSLIDDMASVEALEKQVLGKVASAEVSPSKAARMTKNLDSVMAAVFLKGQLKFKDGWFHLKDAKGGKGFFDIFMPLFSNKDGSLMRLWEGYAGARRASELLEQGRENNYSKDQITSLLALADQYDGKNGKPDFKAIFNEYQEFNRSVLDLAEAAGVINAEERKVWESNDYIPMYRVLDDVEATDVKAPHGKRGLSGQSSGIRQLKGGEEKHGGVLENMVLNMTKLIDASYKNVATQKIIELAEQTEAVEEVDKGWKPTMVSAGQMRKHLEKLGVLAANEDAEAIETETGYLAGAMSKDELAQWGQLFTRWAPQGKDIVPVRVDGKLKYYRVEDPLLLRSLTSMGQPTGSVLKVFRMSKKLLTETVTASPGFMAANYLRDSLVTWIIGGVRMVPVFSGIKSATKAWNEDTIVWQMMAAGAGGGRYYNTRSHEVRKLANQIEKKMKNKGFAETVLDSPDKIWKFWQKIGSVSENANRLLVMDKLQKKGATETEAAYQAMDLLNFTQRGDSTIIKLITETVPFMNARAQGLDRVYRGAKADPRGFALKGGMLAAASFLLYLLNKDDPDYDDLPEWDKDTYWHFFTPAGHFRFPKPFELGAIFATIPERIAEATFKGETKYLKDSVARVMLETLAFNPIPQLVKPLAEDIADRDFFFGTPIVGFDDRLAPEAQYSDRTPISYIMLAEAMPDAAPDIFRSPKRLEHLVRGYTAAVGSTLFWMSDRFLEASGVIDRKETLEITDLPGIKRFIRETEPRATKYATMFYDMKKEADKIYSTVAKYKKSGRIDKAKQKITGNIGKLVAKPGLARVQSQITKINKAADALSINKRLSAAEKEQRKKALRRLKNSLQKKAVEKYGGVFD